jgi:hypothetical protein
MNRALERALSDVQRYCEARVPSEMRDEVILEAGRRGNAIAIVERRPPWNPAYGDDWSSTPIARLRFDPARGAWTLQAQSLGRWIPHPDTSSARHVTPLLRVLDEDPYALFWG